MAPNDHTKSTDNLIQMSISDLPAAAVAREDNFTWLFEAAINDGTRCTPLITFSALFDIFLRVSIYYLLLGKGNVMHERTSEGIPARFKTCSVVFTDVEFKAEELW